MSWNSINLKKIENFLNDLDGKVVLGFDGIVDDVFEIIDKREDLNNFKIIEHMKDFGEVIVSRSTGGFAKEIISKRKISGGFTANTSRAIGNFEVDTTIIGMYGETEILSIYDEFKNKVKMISIGEPAKCNVFEFIDGKLMLSNLEPILEFNFDKLENLLGEENLQKIFNNTKIFCLGYWCNLNDFDNIIKKIIDKYLLKSGVEKIFFDFANINKKSQEALTKTLNILNEYNSKISMSLSLNEHEGAILFNHFKICFSEDIGSYKNALESLSKYLFIDEIMVHTPNFAICRSKKEGTSVSIQNFNSRPVKTAGAGDSYNGGYIVSCLGKLSLTERLSFANAVTSFYIKNGFPPSKMELINEIKHLKEILL